MAVPVAALAKIAAAALSDEDPRRKLGWIIAAICSPLILTLALICSLLSGSAEHNNSAVLLCFNGGNIPGTLDDNNNRLCRILFKCAVELNMLCHTIAAHFRTDPIHTRELRAYAVDEVKRTNGQVSFENAVRSQRRIEPDDAWPGSY